MLSLDLLETGHGNYMSICLTKKSTGDSESQSYLSYILCKSSDGNF